MEKGLDKDLVIFPKFILVVLYYPHTNIYVYGIGIAVDRVLNINYLARATDKGGSHDDDVGGGVGSCGSEEAKETLSFM